MKAGTHRKPAQIHRVRAGGPSRGVTTPVPHVYLPVSLTAPGPSGSTEPTRLRRGCSHPPRRSPAQAASSFTPPLRRQGDGRSLTPIRNNSASWRTWRNTAISTSFASGVGPIPSSPSTRRSSTSLMLPITPEDHATSASALLNGMTHYLHPSGHDGSRARAHGCSARLERQSRIRLRHRCRCRAWYCRAGTQRLQLRAV